MGCGWEGEPRRGDTFIYHKRGVTPMEFILFVDIAFYKAVAPLERVFLHRVKTRMLLKLHNSVTPYFNAG